MPDRKPADPYPLVVEMFREMKPREFLFMAPHEPSCFNGEVSVVRYRITVERIEEPPEVLAERVRKLWRELPYNHHQSGPLRAEAAKYGLTLDPAERAVDAPRPRNARPCR